MTDNSENQWKETVRDIFDKLHFGEYSIFTDNPLAIQLLKFIEEKHYDYFCEEVKPIPTQKVKEN